MANCRNRYSHSVAFHSRSWNINPGSQRLNASKYFSELCTSLCRSFSLARTAAIICAMEYTPICFVTISCSRSRYSNQPLMRRLFSQPDFMPVQDSNRSGAMLPAMSVIIRSTSASSSFNRPFSLAFRYKVQKVRSRKA